MNDIVGTPKQHLKSLRELETSIVDAELAASDAKAAYKDAKDKVAVAINNLRNYIRDMKTGQEAIDFPGPEQKEQNVAS